MDLPDVSERGNQRENGETVSECSADGTELSGANARERANDDEEHGAHELGCEFAENV